jgi:chromosome partitioning protein
VTEEPTAAAVRLAGEGLGWPESSPGPDQPGRFSTGLGWPAERDHPQVGPSFPQAEVTSPLAKGQAPVSRETETTTVVSRETEEPPERRRRSDAPGQADGEGTRGGNRPGNGPGTDGPGLDGPGNDGPGNDGPGNDPGRTVAAIEPPIDAVLTPAVRTVADFADLPPRLDDDSTPLARMAEDTVRARREAARQEPQTRPGATRIMVVANQKGGVGKTTTTVNVAAGLAQLGQRVLVIDLDPQGNASTALGVEHQRGVPSTYDALVEGEELAGLVSPVRDLPRLDAVPATIDLAGAEIELVSLVARENRLRRAIVGHPRVGSEETAGADRYDYVLVDCPPSLGLLTLNALVAGEEMLIPIQAEYYALEGLGQLIETVEMVKAHLNPGLVVSTIVITMYDARTRLASGVAEEVREHFGDQVLQTTIPRSVRVSEAPSYGQTVMTYDPGSPGALSYLEAAREIARKGAPR